MKNCGTCEFEPDWEEAFDNDHQWFSGNCGCQNGKTIAKYCLDFFSEAPGVSQAVIIDCKKHKPKSTSIPKTSPEEWAQEFLKEHLTGEQIFEKYEKWCQENNRPVIKSTVFFLKIYQYFGAL